METDVKGIEVLCQERIELFQSLLECVTREKDSLIELNIKQLWSLMEQKQEIIEALEVNRNRMGELMDLDDPYSQIPLNDRKKIMGFFRQIEMLKIEIRRRVQENVSIIQGSLTFFHDLVSIFANSGKKENTYEDLVRGKATDSPCVLYQSEA
jgi:flagellar biosynthesis/type III secretory pathway chaperone